MKNEANLSKYLCLISILFTLIFFHLIYNRTFFRLFVLFYAFKLNLIKYLLVRFCSVVEICINICINFKMSSIFIF